MSRISSTFDIDATPRRADGEFMAHAKITAGSGSETQIFMSGDLAGFDARDDAIAYARSWAGDWIEAFVRLSAR
ncbi:hypothetical protein IAG25_37860 [Caballeronia sp. EK]|uniref:hypothetical protein n=1 Tax=Caballeronia sp. EK TaxID=2767469 RepID=UPI0016560E63|nr:hypothetical protein [Caballeronia sp. EK]MBC8642570.1 hypothetical protein [Caballeronia sp. EK]